MRAATLALEVVEWVGLASVGCGLLWLAWALLTDPEPG